MSATPANLVVNALAGLGQTAILAWEAATSAFKHRIAWRDVLFQVYFMGVKSQSVVLIMGAFTGMVLGAQTYFQLHKVGMDSATLAVVSVSMCSELGPVLAGLMVAGRVGAAIAAEIGTMRVTEQIDALRTLATHPVDYLVVPRLLAAHIVLPLLTIESIAIGIASAHVLGLHWLGISRAYSWVYVQNYTDASDVAMGLVKAIIFGGMIALIGCYKGLNCGEGAEGVGRATTQAVVFASIAILISNFFLTLGLRPVLEALL